MFDSNRTEYFSSPAVQFISEAEFNTVENISKSKIYCLLCGLVNLMVKNVMEIQGINN